MSNWIESGGNAPRQFGDAYLERNLAARWKLPLRITCALLLVALVSPFGHARDLDGRYAAENPELHKWVDVPDEAVITEPNRIGRTMVWPIRGYLGLTIRCFMPGQMS